MTPADGHHDDHDHAAHGEVPVDCDELFGKLDLLMDRELPQHELDRLETHLARCLPCAGRRDFETQLRNVVRDRCCDEAPDELVTRIRERLELPQR
jgi:mycothiol system anti-sigma-R factor